MNTLHMDNLLVKMKLTREDNSAEIKLKGGNLLVLWIFTINLKAVDDLSVFTWWTNIFILLILECPIIKKKKLIVYKH